MTELEQVLSDPNMVIIPPALDDAGLSAEAFRVYCHLARLQPPQWDDEDRIFIPPALDDAGLSPEAFRVYCHLARRTLHNRDDEWPSPVSMAHVCRMDRDLVWHALEELMDCGMVVREKREELPSRYVLTKPSIWAEKSK